MLEAKKIVTKMITDVDKAIQKFIKRNESVIREISIWDGYYATDNSLSLKAFGLNNANGGFYRVYRKKNEYSKNLAQDVVLAGQFKPVAHVVAYANIIIHPDLSYTLENHTYQNQTETVLCKTYCVLYELLPILQQADLKKILPARMYDDINLRNKSLLLFDEPSVSRMSYILNNSNPGHWAHGDIYHTFIYHFDVNNTDYIIDMEAYDSEAYCLMRTKQLREMNFMHIYDIYGNFITSVMPQDFKNLGYSNNPHSGSNSITSKIDINKVLIYMLHSNTQNNNQKEEI